MKLRSRAIRTRHGGVLVLLAVCLVALLGILALGMDGGRMMEERRRTRAAVDAAALAAATAWSDSIDTSPSTNPATAAQQAALNTAAANGYANDGTTSLVTVNIPPQTGPFSGQNGYFEVLLQSNIQGSFSQVFTQSNLAVQARSVARFKQQPLGLISLSANALGAVTITGNSKVSVQSGSVIVNSTSSAAYIVSINASVKALSNLVTGGLSLTGNGSLQGKLTTQATPTPDPLAALPLPVVSVYPLQSTSPLTLTGPTTLQPGVYEGGISISANAQVTLSPGIYILNGGGLQLAGNASISGSGAMIYNTGNPAGPISIAGNGSINLSPPLTGAYVGVCLFQDPAVNQTISLAGNGGLTLSGQIYAPAAPVTMTGNSAATSTCGGIVCSTCSIGGNSSLNINTTIAPQAVIDLRLVE